MYSSGAKRLVDLVISIPALILSLPVQAAVAGMVAIRLGRPVLFKQVRPGLHGQPFVLIKFRTMIPVSPDRPSNEDQDRMTPIGAFLRATSLDELPTLWNIVRGDMSVVGPRPLLMSYLERYTSDQARRHEVKPGLTGLAQISGRNTISWEEKFALDAEYVDNNTFRSDIKIMISTVGLVLRREGITAQGHITTAEFLGSPGRHRDIA